MFMPAAAEDLNVKYETPVNSFGGREGKKKGKKTTPINVLHLKL